jgi:hypothetical protein
MDPSVYTDDNARACNLRKAIRLANARAGKRLSWAEAVQDPMVASALDGLYEPLGALGAGNTPILFCMERNGDGFRCVHEVSHPNEDHQDERGRTWPL